MKKDNMNFLEAVEAMEQGNLVARRKWKDKGEAWIANKHRSMFQKGYIVSVHKELDWGEDDIAIIKIEEIKATDWYIVESEVQ